MIYGFLILKILPIICTSFHNCLQIQIAVAVFNLEGAMGPLALFLINWHLDKIRVVHLYHYVNKEIK